MHKPWLDKRLPLRYDNCILIFMLLMLDVVPNYWHVIRGIMIVIILVLLPRLWFHKDEVKK